MVGNPHIQENAARVDTMTRMVVADFLSVRAQAHCLAVSFFSQKSQNSYRVKAVLIFFRRYGRTRPMIGNRLDRTVF